MRDIYQDVTDKIVTALDQGVAPWSSSGSAYVGNHQPYPINAITRRPYSGINLPLSGPKPGCRDSLKIVG